MTTLLKISARYARRPAHLSEAKGVATTGFRFAADGIRENGKSNIWGRPYSWPSRLTRGLWSRSASCA